VKTVAILTSSSGGQSSVVFDARLASGMALAGVIAIAGADRIRGIDLANLSGERSRAKLLQAKGDEGVRP